jgi:hypothetical protein
VVRVIRISILLIYSSLCGLCHAQIDLPGYSSFALRQIKQATPAYQDLVTANSTNDAEAFVKVIAKYHDKLVDDKNLGLAVHCHESITRRNIRRLTEMFLTMSLSAIAERVSVSALPRVFYFDRFFVRPLFKFDFDE